MNEQELIFSMDIGTRSVVGIVGRHDGEKLNIIAYEIEEHKERAMYDGQVHDIELVAKAAGKVVQRLEEKLGIKLKNVAVAAAGRSLKTHKVFVDRKVDATVEIDRETISSLEIEAIQKSQQEIEEMQHDDGHAYYCVGYAVINYYLNGSIIGNLEGHRGSNIGIGVLSTFLPKIVIDSLYAVVSRIGLEVTSLTLEPIAAMNVCIQSNLRLLNIALVDIGAGTSDIALTKDGTVFAFAMVPTAGDEITEKLAEAYLLDFDTAEKVKINLNKKGKIKFKDIMELSHQVSTNGLTKAIQPAVQNLAKEISDEIIEYNGKSPSAVFLVGGGSQVPGLIEAIANHLQIPLERVGLRKTSLIKDVDITDDGLLGPAFITPIGIAVTALLNRQKDFLNVFVNEKSIKLFHSKSLTVADALILVGFNPRSLIGRRGTSLTFTINGKVEIVKGELGESARIFVNCLGSSLDRALINGDRIVIDPAVDGKNAEAYIREYAGFARPKTIYINQLEQVLHPMVTVNGVISSMDEKIKDQDIIEIKTVVTLEDVMGISEINADEFGILLNGRQVDLKTLIQHGDQVTLEKRGGLTSFLEIEEEGDEISVVINGRQLFIKKDKNELMFIDIFNHIDIDVSKIKGIHSLKLNGNPANYTDVIKNGDIIEIDWEN